MSGNLSTRTVIATGGFLLVIAFFLTTEHRAHLFGVLPFLFLLACPLLHVFAHGGHGAHGEREGHGDHGAPPDPAGRGRGDPHAGHHAAREDVR